MRRVIFPGKSPKTVIWYYDAKKLYADFDFLKYDHWRNESFDVVKDFDAAKKLLDEDSLVIARDLGCIYAFAKKNVKGRVLCSLPVSLALLKGFDLMKSLEESTVKTLVILNEDDPNLKFEKFKVSNPLVEVVMGSGSKGSYDLVEVDRIIKSKGFYD